METTELQIEYTARDESWLDRGEVAVPLELELRDGLLRVWYYPSAKHIADELFAAFGKSEHTLFSGEAMAFASRRFGEFLEERGFSLSPDSHDFYICYSLPPSLEAPEKEVRRLTAPCEYRDLTDTDIDGLIAEGYIIYAAISDGAVAALANTGVPVGPDTPREIEIGVDTAEKYRRRGLGAACVRALTRELYLLGHTVIYECASKNTASIWLAESLGGSIAAKKIYIVGFSDPVDELVED